MEHVPPAVAPLLPDDPPQLGGYWIDGRLVVRESGVAFVGHRDDASALVLVLSDGAAGNPAARDRFAAAINELHIDTVVARGGQGQSEGRLAKKYVAPAEDAPPAPDGLVDAPWAVLRFDHSPAAVAEASRILESVDQLTLAQQGNVAGPDYQPYWIENTRTGFARIWPLPWPGRHDRAGWVSILMSWLLMVLLALIALVTAILLFRNTPQSQPPPPLPTTATPSDPQQSSSSPSQSPPPSGSASPTPSGSGSPSPSGSGSPSSSSSPSSSGSPSSSSSPTPTPSATVTASAMPSPRNTRL